MNITPNTNCNLDPVKCLKFYFARTQDMRPCDTKSLFISLKQPYKALKSDSMGHILEETISLAVGLQLNHFALLGVL